MSAESECYDKLRLNAGVAAFVGTRIHPYIRPQNDVLPAIVYSRTATTPISTIHGTVYAVRTQITIDAFSATRMQAEQIADAIEIAMNGSLFLRLNRSGDALPDMDIETTTLVYDHFA